MGTGATPNALRAVISHPAPAPLCPYVSDWFSIHHRIAMPVRRYLTITPKLCDALVDIGAGDGAVLDDIASRFPQLPRLVGITTSPSSLNLARIRASSDRRIEFVQASPWSWLRLSKRQRLMLFSYDNLSALSEQALEHWFQMLSKQGVTSLVLVEPQNGGCFELPQMLNRAGWHVGYSEAVLSYNQAWWHVFASPYAAPTKKGGLP